MSKNQGFSQKRHKNKNASKKNALPQKNKVYDSTGPFGSKVRGTAQQVHEKYIALARDAYTSGDRVNYESYAQHAEHYYRELQKINAAHAEVQRLQAEAQAAAAAQKQAEAKERASVEMKAQGEAETEVATKAQPVEVAESPKSDANTSKVASDQVKADSEKPKRGRRKTPQKDEKAAPSDLTGDKKKISK